MEVANQAHTDWTHRIGQSVKSHQELVKVVRVSQSQSESVRVSWRQILAESLILGQIWA